MSNLRRIREWQKEEGKERVKVTRFYGEDK